MPWCLHELYILLECKNPRVSIEPHCRVTRQILFAKFRDTAMTFELRVCLHVFLTWRPEKKCRFYDREYYTIQHKKLMIFIDMSPLCFGCTTRISFIADVFVSIFTVIVYCTCLLLCFLRLSLLWFVLCVLRTRGNHLTNRGYLINYQNGYMTEWHNSEGREQVWWLFVFIKCRVWLLLVGNHILGDSEHICWMNCRLMLAIS